MSLARPRLRLPCARNVIERIAAAAGYTIRASQTGRLNTTLGEEANCAVCPGDSSVATTASQPGNLSRGLAAAHPYAPDAGH